MDEHRDPSVDHRRRGGRPEQLLELDGQDRPAAVRVVAQPDPVARTGRSARSARVGRRPGRPSVGRAPAGRRRRPPAEVRPAPGGGQERADRAREVVEQGGIADVRPRRRRASRAAAASALGAGGRRGATRAAPGPPSQSPSSRAATRRSVGAVGHGEDDRVIAPSDRRRSATTSPPRQATSSTVLELAVEHVEQHGPVDRRGEVDARLGRPPAPAVTSVDRRDGEVGRAGERIGRRQRGAAPVGEQHRAPASGSRAAPTRSGHASATSAPMSSRLPSDRAGRCEPTARMRSASRRARASAPRRTSTPGGAGRPRRTATRVARSACEPPPVGRSGSRSASTPARSAASPPTPRSRPATTRWASRGCSGSDASSRPCVVGRPSPSSAPSVRSTAVARDHAVRSGWSSSARSVTSAPQTATSSAAPVRSSVRMAGVA